MPIVISKVKPLALKACKLCLSLSIALTVLSTLSITTIQSAHANTCSCNQGKLHPIDIEELNDTHPHQLTLKANNAYYQLVDNKGAVIQDKLYAIKTYEDGRIVAKRNGYFGAIDSTGNVAVDFKYDAIDALDNGFYQLTEHFGSKAATAIVTASGNWLYPASHTFDKNTQVDYLYGDKVNQITYFSVSKNGKHGLITDKPQTLIAPIYDELTLLDTCPNERLFMKAVMGDQTGLIDQYQKVVVPFAKNIDIKSFNEDKQIFSVRSYKSKTDDYDDDNAVVSEQLINGKGVLVIHSDSGIKHLNDNLYEYKKASHYGLIDNNGSIVLPANSDGSITHLKDNLYIYKKLDKYGIINDNGTTMLPANFDYINSNYDAPIMMIKNQKMGILNEDDNNNLKIDTFYDDLERYYDTTYTLSDIENQALKEDDYNEEKDTSHTIYYIAELNDKFGLVDNNNKVVVPIIYDEFVFFEHFIKVKKDNKYGLITENNDIIKPPIYDDIASLSDSHGDSIGMIFTKGNQQQLTNQFGRVLNDFSDYRFINDKLYGLDNISVIKKDGKYGLFSLKDKKVIIPPIYEDVFDRIYNNSILAQLDGKKVLIDTSGKTLIDDLSQYAEIDRSSDSDKIKVKTKNDKYGLIDYAGKIIIAPIYDSLEISELSNDYINVWNADKSKNSIERYIVEKNGKYGVFNPSGKLISPIAYTYIQPILYPPYFLVTKDEVNNENIDSADSINFGLMSPEGKLVLEMKYYDAIVPNYYDPDGKIYAIDIHQNSVDIYDKTLTLLETQNLTTFEADNEWYGN